MWISYILIAIERILALEHVHKKSFDFIYKYTKYEKHLHKRNVGIIIDVQWKRQTLEQISIVPWTHTHTYTEIDPLQNEASGDQ